jgi:hypothetical protein
MSLTYSKYYHPYRTRRFTTMVRRARCWPLFWLIQSNPSYTTFLTVILMLLFHLLMRLSVGLFPSMFQTSSLSHLFYVRDVPRQPEFYSFDRLNNRARRRNSLITRLNINKILFSTWHQLCYRIILLTVTNKGRNRNTWNTKPLYVKLVIF